MHLLLHWVKVKSSDPKKVIIEKVTVLDDNL